MSAHNNIAVQEELVIVLISVALLENLTLCSLTEADSNLKGAEIQTVFYHGHALYTGDVDPDTPENSAIPVP